LDYSFKKPALLRQALTHRSHTNETSSSLDNERMEFLGDAFTELVVSRMLYDAHPLADEGALSKMRANLVSAEALSKRCARYGTRRRAVDG
jgi:ribonuclease-3